MDRRGGNSIVRLEQWSNLDLCRVYRQWTALSRGYSKFAGKHAAIVVAICTVLFTAVPAMAQQEIRSRQIDAGTIAKICDPQTIVRLLGGQMPWLAEDQAPPTQLYVGVTEFELRTAPAAAKRFAFVLISHNPLLQADRSDLADRALASLLGPAAAVVSERERACPDFQIRVDRRHPTAFRELGRFEEVRRGYWLFGEAAFVYRHTPLALWALLPGEREPIGPLVVAPPPTPAKKAVVPPPSPGRGPAKPVVPGALPSGTIDEKAPEVAADVGEKPTAGADPLLDTPGSRPPAVSHSAPIRRPPAGVKDKKGPGERVVMLPVEPAPDAKAPALTRKYDPPGYLSPEMLTKGPVVPLRAADLSVQTGTVAKSKPGNLVVFAPEKVECSDEGNWVLGYMALLTPPAPGAPKGTLLIRQRYAMNNYVGEGRTTRADILRQFPRAACENGRVQCSAPKQVRSLAADQYHAERTQLPPRAPASGETTPPSGDKAGGDKAGGLASGSPTGWRCLPDSTRPGFVECRSRELLHWHCSLSSIPETDTCQAVEPARWWCVPRREFCFSRARFGDWGAELKEGDRVEVNLADDKVYDLAHGLVPIAKHVLTSNCGNGLQKSWQAGWRAVN